MNNFDHKKSVFALMREEIQLLFYDKWLLFATTALPAILFSLMFCLFRQGIVRELPLAMVNMDQGQFSRMLIREYNSSSHLLIKNYPSVQQATAALRAGKVYGVVVLPTSMSKKIRLGESPKVTVFYNFQFILVGKALKSAVTTAHATFNAKIATVAGLARGNVQLVQAQGSAVVTRKQITPLYNLGLNYGQFLVTALVPTIWQILMVAVTVLVWAAENRRSGLVNWFRTQTMTKMIIRLGLYQIIFLLQGAAFIAAFIAWGWSAQNGLATMLPALFLAQWLTVLACLGIGSFFFINIPDATRSLSLVTSYVAPSFAFLGVTFPVSDMNTFARVWHSILPISYYMKIQIGVMNHGASFATLLPYFRSLCYFLLLFVLIGIVICKKKAKAAKAVRRHNELA